MKKQHEKVFLLCAAGLFILFCILAGWLIGVPMIRLANDPDALRTWVDERGFPGKLLFIGMVFLQVLVALIPGEPVELAAGYAFGFWEGSLLAMLGILLGSAVIFLLVRKFGMRLVELFFSHREIKKLAFLKNSRKTEVLAFLLMLIPGTPKDLLSYFAGLTRLKLERWLLIVAVARIPSLITSTAAGAAAGAENYLLAGIVFGLTGVVSIAGVLYYRKLSRESVESE